MADLPLLFEYVLTVATFLPKANELIEQDFTPKNLEAREYLCDSPQVSRGNFDCTSPRGRGLIRRACATVCLSAVRLESRMTDIASYLARTFEADRDAPDYYERFKFYGPETKALGLMPHWPPLSSVWKDQGEPPSWAHLEYRESTAEAWALLQHLHGEYLKAKSKG